MFTFTPLYGAQSTSKASASILEFDGGVKILIDVGWDATFSNEVLKLLETHTPTLSLILLTHATVDHIGAYAHACKNIPLFTRIPVYATIPVINLGLTLLNDLYASSLLAAGTIPSESLGGAPDEPSQDILSLLLQKPSVEETARYFNHITPLKYSQPHQPSPTETSPPLAGLTITAYTAGHTLGGTIWHLQHGLESVVYAADWNQNREHLLAGAAWLSSASGGAEIIEPLRRPTALICSSRGVEVENTLPRRKRDETLISHIRDIIVQGGRVLIPTDSSARVLELAFLLNQAWRENADGPHAATYKSAKVYMASKSAVSTQKYLQSMLEWMDDSVVRNAEAAMTSKSKDKTSNPLQWDYIHVIEKQSQLDRALKRSKSSVILASDTTIEWGYSRYAFEKLATGSDNLIILTELPKLPGTVSAMFWQQSQIETDPAKRAITIRVAEAESLNSNQQQVYDQYMAQQAALSNDAALPADGTEPINGVEAALLDDAASDSSDSDDDADADAEQQGRVLNLSTQLASNKRKAGFTDTETGIDLLLTAKEYDYDVQGKRGRERLFPFRQTRKRNDDFGEPINVSEYLRAEEREETDASTLDTSTDRKVGEKRKWDDVSTAATNTSQKGQDGSNGQHRRARTNGSRRRGSLDEGVVRTNGTTNAAADSSSGSESDESEYEPDETEEAGPKRVVFTEIELKVSARCRHVDFSALHDKRDLLMLIPLIRPRKLIVFGGSEVETQILAESSAGLLEGRANGVKADGKKSQIEVYSPRNGDVIDASVDTNAWSLKLGRNLLKKLVWQDIRGIGIVALTGLLTTEQEQPKQKQEELEDEAITRKKRKLGIEHTPVVQENNSGDQELPLLDLPATFATSRLPVQTTSVNRPIHVGDLRLSDLRNLLRAGGHTADFRGEGTLLVDGIVVVRKGAAGRIEVEGNVFGTNGKGAIGEVIFDDVRRRVYQGLAVVGSGQATAA